MFKVIVYEDRAAGAGNYNFQLCTAVYNTGVSPRGETLSPMEPPAKTAPTVKGRPAPVLTASGRPRGIISAQDGHLKFGV